MDRWLGYAETGITWLERTPWGQRMIAVGLAAAISAWTWIAARYPLPIIVIVFITLIWMLLDIEARVISYALARFAPPVFIEANNMAMRSGLGLTESQRAMRWVDVAMYVLNRSRARRVSLVISVEIHPSNMNACYLDTSLVEVRGLQLNLGPEEETRGAIRFAIPDVKMKFEPHIIAKDFFFLIVADRISRRSVQFHIPGVYPEPKM